MGSVSVSWSVSLPVDGVGDVQTVEADLTLTLVNCPSGSTVAGDAIIKIGVTYYNGDGTPIDLNGNPLGAGVVYSYYEEVTRKSGLGASPLLVIALKTNHAAGAVCGAHKPAQAVSALYRYYTVCNHSSPNCSGCTGSNVYGPTSQWGTVTFTQGGGGGGE